MLPRLATIADFPIRMKELINVVAEVENRKAAVVLFDLTLAPFDVIRVRSMDADAYGSTVARMRDNLLDRDTAPGAEPEDLMKLDIPAMVVPGRDESHATSAARYLEECLPRAQYWDAPPEAQTAESAAPRLIDFLESATSR